MSSERAHRIRTVRKAAVSGGDWDDKTFEPYAIFKARKAFERGEITREEFEAITVEYRAP